VPWRFGRVENRNGGDCEVIADEGGTGSGGEMELDGN
jgi:hypothetical protein